MNFAQAAEYSLIGCVIGHAGATVFTWAFKPKTANTKWTTKNTILEQMHEPRPLPMGQKEFVEWSDRIISGALIPCDDRDSLVGALSAMLMQLPSTESHKPDAYFIHSLRKAAVNEVAHFNFQNIKNKKAEEATQEKEALQEAKKAAESVAIANDDKARQEAKISNLTPKR